MSNQKSAEVGSHLISSPRRDEARRPIGGGKATLRVVLSVLALLALAAPSQGQACSATAEVSVSSRPAPGGGYAYTYTVSVEVGTSDCSLVDVGLRKTFARQDGSTFTEEDPIFFSGVRGSDSKTISETAGMKLQSAQSIVKGCRKCH
jgi:hypothetical protein